MNKQNNTLRLTGTAVLFAMVIVFDYALRYSGLKIPFPWYPNLKFDFTGVPISLCLFLYGFPSSLMTSLVAGLGIIVRSGNIISASMKVAAEVSTVSGLYLGSLLCRDSKESKYISSLLGLIGRVLVMTIVNLYVLPNVYGLALEATLGLLPLIAVFNTIQGGITIGLGYFLFKAIKTRLTQYIPVESTK